mmetsp:Transcript_67926/g.152162  ORF Transcript_67926/g.152162 Transcript_67926/m.152162 type:complete len:89 (+) Transcript_67926:189-455(+)
MEEDRTSRLALYAPGPGDVLRDLPMRVVLAVVLMCEQPSSTLGPIRSQPTRSPRRRQTSRDLTMTALLEQPLLEPYQLEALFHARPVS